MRLGRFLWIPRQHPFERAAKAASPQVKTPKLRQAGAFPKCGARLTRPATGNTDRGNSVTRSWDDAVVTENAIAGSLRVGETLPGDGGVQSFIGGSPVAERL